MITEEHILKLFQACKSLKCLTQLHSLTIKTGLTHNTFFATKLINLYSELGQLRTTRKLFDETPHKTVHIWNHILKCYCREKQYKEALFIFSDLFSSKKPDNYTISIALKACAGLKALDFGQIIQGYVNKSGLIGEDLFVGSGLVDLYSKCGEMDSALRVFEEYSEPDSVLWTTMVSGYEHNGEPIQAVHFFSQMAKASGIWIDNIILISVLSACARLLSLNAGRSVHGYMIKAGFDSCLPLLNALLSFYGKTGFINAAANLFNKMEDKDVISWGSMISCYAHHGKAGEALDLFDDMVSIGVEPNAVVLISALQSCEATGNLEKGKQLHEIAARKCMDLDIMISTALIDMYMNCSSPDKGIEVFERLKLKDYVCYSALLSGLVRHGMFYKSMGVFLHMLADDIRPGVLDMIKILTVCSELGILQETICIHGFITKTGMETHRYIGASLIETYAKCGSLNGAISVFEEIKDRDDVIWSSMFSGYGFHGKGHEALELLDQMIKNSSVKPNGVSFVSILSACSHAGLVHEGIEMFSIMVNEYKITPNLKHYGIVVDLLGRISELETALEFISQMPEPVGANVWGALLGACRIHQNMELGEVAAKKVLELDPDQTGHYVLLSNLYAVDEKWNDVVEVRNLVKEKNLKKVSGQSVV